MSDGRLRPPWCGVASACHRPPKTGRFGRPRTPRASHTAVSRYEASAPVDSEKELVRAQVWFGNPGGDRLACLIAEFEL